MTKKQKNLVIIVSITIVAVLATALELSHPGSLKAIAQGWADGYLTWFGYR